MTEILLAMEKAKHPVIFPVHPRNKKLAGKIYEEYKLQNIILTEPVGYFDSIHLIKNALTVVTDSGGVLQEAYFAYMPYVFVLDIPKVAENIRFDVSRLVKPDRQMVLQKVNEKQEFAEKTILSEQINNIISSFEENVLRVLREFEKDMKNRPDGSKYSIRYCVD